MNYRLAFVCTFLLVPLHAMEKNSFKSTLPKQELPFKKQEVNTFALLSFSSMIAAGASGHKLLTVATAIPCTYFIGTTFKKNIKQENFESAIEQFSKITSRKKITV